MLGIIFVASNCTHPNEQELLQQFFVYLLTIFSLCVYVIEGLPVY